MKLNNNILNIDEFPTLPTIFTRLQDVMNHPRSSANDVADIIMQDQSAASKVLKISNSAMYGYVSKINTVTQAVMLLGQNEIKNIVLTLSILDMFKNVRSNTYLNPVDLWKYSIASGFYNKILAERLELENIEEFFLSGLLHPIGKLVFLKTIPDMFSKILTYSYENQILTKEVERKVIGLTSYEAAELLLEKWKLPKYLRNSAGNYNFGQIDGRDDTHTGLVHISAFMVNQMSIGNSAEFKNFNLNRTVLNEFNFDKNTFTSILPKFNSQYLQSSQLLLSI